MVRAVLAFAILATVFVIFVAAGGCGATITPPLNPADPVRVYIIDYGRHTSLVLPRESGAEHVEYSYGEWGWYANNRTGPIDALRALIIPSRGALGRRVYDQPIEEETLRSLIVFDRIRSFTVGHSEAAALVIRLDERYESARETEIYNRRHDLEFVHDERRYTFFVNCNPVLASWLRELGCEVRGPALLAHWRFAEPDAHN